MAKQPRILAGQTVAISGAGRGIGAATATALIGQGMKVALGDIDLDMARQTASRLGDSAVALPLDVTDRSSFCTFLDEAEEQLGPVDVLINNAGIMQLGRFIEEDDETAARMVDINLHGVIFGMKLALARMIPRDRGHIVNISSQAGKYGTPGGATYSATKHAVVGLTEAVRGELRQMGAHIDLTYVMPFVVATELASGAGKARGMNVLLPDEVATAIVQALQHGTVDVWVPKAAKRRILTSALLPRPVADAAYRLLKTDKVLAGADTRARQGYELRVSRRTAPSRSPIR